jgi:hypothetical protein
MGLFKKKQKKEEIPRLPELPELPRLPELPELPETEEYTEEIPRLPSFPSDTLGNKFSQDFIKEAVTGEKEEGFKVDEFAKEEGMQRIQKPLVREETGKEFYPKIEQRVKEAEPIFVRMDKFEEGSRIFEEVKGKVTEIEKMFNDIKKIKEKEERELEFWEEEIRSIKEKIEKIDKNIFSKIE